MSERAPNCTHGTGTNWPCMQRTRHASGLCHTHRHARETRANLREIPEAQIRALLAIRDVVGDLDAGCLLDTYGIDVDEPGGAPLGIAVSDLWHTMGGGR